ncbi:type II and III secretion system protein family protein [Aliidiomarina sp. Khilg15.8]
MWVLLWLGLQAPLPVIELYRGAMEVVVPGGAIERVAVGRGDVIETRVMDNREVLIMGLAPGYSQVRIWHEGGVYITAVQVLPAPVPGLQRALQSLRTTQPNLHLDTLGDTFKLSGKVSRQTLQQLTSLAERYPQLLLAVEPEAPEMAALIELEVQVMELKSRHLRSLGVRWQQVANGPAVGIISDWVGGSHFRAMGSLTSALVPDISSLALEPGHYGYAGLTTALSSQLQLLEERGEARMLASPVLRTESGSTAEFLAGGEVPLPQTNLQGAMDVAFKSYGIRLHIEPEQLADGSIRTAVMTEVSNLDPAVSVNGIPGLLTRRTESQVALPAGQTFVISGLRSEDVAHSEQGLPGLGKAPVMGSLFRSRVQNRSETELVIFITPRLVKDEAEQSELRIERVEKLERALQRQGCRGMQSYL